MRHRVESFYKEYDAMMDKDTGSDSSIKDAA
jgi:hypothetical protein